MAMGTVWLTAAGIIASFKISEAVDNDGNLIHAYIEKYIS